MTDSQKLAIAVRALKKIANRDPKIPSPYLDARYAWHFGWCKGAALSALTELGVEISADEEPECRAV